MRFWRRKAWKVGSLSMLRYFFEIVKRVYLVCQVKRKVNVNDQNFLSRLSWSVRTKLLDQSLLHSSQPRERRAGK